VVARADPPALRRGDPGRREARGAVRGPNDGRVVDTETLTAWGVGSGTHRYTPFSRFAPFSTTPHSPLSHVFHNVHRTPLSFGILVSRRRLAPRAAGAHGREPGLPGARAHRPQRHLRRDGLRRALRRGVRAGEFLRRAATKLRPRRSCLDAGTERPRGRRATWRRGVGRRALPRARASPAARRARRDPPPHYARRLARRAATEQRILPAAAARSRCAVC